MYMINVHKSFHLTSMFRVQLAINSGRLSPSPIRLLNYVCKYLKLFSNV